MIIEISNSFSFNDPGGDENDLVRTSEIIEKYQNAFLYMFIPPNCAYGYFSIHEK